CPWPCSGPCRRFAQASSAWAVQGQAERQHGLTTTGQRLTTGLMQQIEEKLAHLIRTVDDLSDIVARQEKEIALLTHRLQMLMKREAEREGAADGQVFLGDERPPHW